MVRFDAERRRNSQRPVFFQLVELGIRQFQIQRHHISPDRQRNHAPRTVAGLRFNLAKKFFLGFIAQVSHVFDYDIGRQPVLIQVIQELRAGFLPGHTGRQNLTDRFTCQQCAITYPAFHVDDICRVNPVRFPAATVRIEIHILAVSELLRVVDVDLYLLRIQRIHAFNFSVWQPIDIRVPVAVVIPAILKVCKKLDWCHVRIRPILQEKRRIMVRNTVFVGIH